MTNLESVGTPGAQSRPHARYRSRYPVRLGPVPKAAVKKRWPAGAGELGRGAKRCRCPEKDVHTCVDVWGRFLPGEMTMTTKTSSIGPAADTLVAGERRSERLDLRVTPSEAAFIRQAAASQRQSVTEFLTSAAVAAATTAADQERRVVLMNEVFDRLVDELDEPEQAIPALAALIKRPRRLRMPE